MKHISIGVIFAALLATTFVGCRQGDKGEPGPAGASASTPAYKSGSITGQLEGTTYTNDSAFTLNLNYQYYKSTADNAFNVVYGEGGTSYNYSITRYDSTGNSYIKFDFSLDYYDPQLRTTELTPEIYNTYVTIVSNRKLSNNNMFYFGTTTDYNYPFNVSPISLVNYTSPNFSSITYDNLVVDSSTGLISFDYSIELGYYPSNSNSTGNSATMTGSISATPYNVVYRQAAE
ncbi:hypothetical protein [Cytophaga aurantiaca]|uniref:hypothetical protein n=1 Tax=Cytophaga aurantiaca TaxID=29530 RepID=UPI000360D90E|nr:hypothetical protein [Cytophaga aurantiaca]